jgi:hypothetical protein
MEETVSLTQFMLATLVITPKLALHVWVGQRIYFLADPNSRSQMDDTTKMINGFYIAGGSLLGFFTGLYVYRLTMKCAFVDSLSSRRSSLKQTSEK